MQRVIQIHPAAPAKPAWGEPCNGCGVCCLAEPCPVGVLASRRRRGACAALEWVEPGGYRCGVLLSAGRLGGPRWVARAAQRLVRRLIAAGAGCDCDYDVG